MTRNPCIWNNIKGRFQLKGIYSTQEYIADRCVKARIKRRLPSHALYTHSERGMAGLLDYLTTLIQLKMWNGRIIMNDEKYVEGRCIF
jgi:hypothetical protein